MEDKRITEAELRALAEAACEKANGPGWRTMWEGDQEAQISSFIDGYRACAGRPYFEILEQGFSGSWEVGETIVVPGPEESIQVPREMLERWLSRMEADWLQIDLEWGTTPGGLEASVARGEEPEIAQMRELLDNSGRKGND